MQTAKPRRRGTVSVLFPLLAVGLLGIAGVAIDMGLARVTQQRMQSAVDAAAVEGLRQGATTDTSKRSRVADLVQWVFDDNFSTDTNPREPHDPYQFGAGPLIATTGGVGPPELGAGQLIEIDEARVYKPNDSGPEPGHRRLQFNTTNLPHGDMIQGRLTPLNGLPPGDRPTEGSQYNRNDFTPDSERDTAADGVGDAFLVRMRRTADRDVLDHVDGVSSRGPPLPLLFGKGSWVQSNPNDPVVGPYDPVLRTDGVTVRATAIATAVPARTAGVRTDGIVEGAAPFAITVTDWAGANYPSARAVDSSNGVVIGTMVSATSVTVTDGPAAGTPFYVPLYTNIPAGNNTEPRVVGFGLAFFNPETGQMQKFAETLATTYPAVSPHRPSEPFRNVSATIVAPPSLTAPGAWSAVLAANAALRISLSVPLVPVLAR